LVRPLEKIMQKQFIFKELTEEKRLARIDRNNPSSPFSKFIGNDKAVRKFQVAAYNALGEINHQMRELAFSIFGPSSAGKTTIARIYAETVNLPLIEINPKSIKTMDDIFRQIVNVFELHELPLIELRPKHYTLPSCIIFIDEVHALADGIVQGLLKATEFKDGVMVTESGKVINTYHVTWIIATTDEGKLFDAFRNRFSPVVLNYLNKAEIAQLIKNEYPHLPSNVCELVAHYNPRVPRKALEFARYMCMVQQMQKNDSWEQIAKQVASDEGIDEFGMHEIHLSILRALANGPVAKNRIVNITGRKEEEVERFIIPYLLTETDEQKALITVSTKGYSLTEAGIYELERRKISCRFVA